MNMECAGGAKDCNAFLQSSFSSNYPSPNSITYEGTFNQHYFAVPPTEREVVSVDFVPCNFPDPISGKRTTPMLCMGMASKFDGSGLRNLGGRPPVELVFALDISGSMSSSFDLLDEKKKREGKVAGREMRRIQKLEAAKQALVGLLENLKEGDSFGLITFNHTSQEIIPLQPFNETLRLKVKKQMKNIQSTGGTNLENAATASVAQYGPDEPLEQNKTKGDDTKKQLPLRRVFFLTDMLLNERNSKGLLEIYRKATERNRPIHSTVIGFGFDFDVSLTELLATVPGCNYFTVTDPDEYLHQMTWEFDYLVFPIASDLKVSLTENSDATVVAVCGSPTPIADFGDKKTLMYCSSLFASETQGKKKEGTKGGVMLAVLSFPEEQKEPRTLELKVEFTSYDGSKSESFSKVTFDCSERSAKLSSEPTGSELLVRKALALSQIVCLIKCILRDIERREPVPSVTREGGLPFGLLEMERNAKNSNGFGAARGDRPPCLDLYAPMIRDFLDYYKKEEAVLDDFGLGLWRSSLEKYLEEEKK